MKIQKNLDWLLVFYIHEVPEYVIYSEKLLHLIAQCQMKPHSEVWVLVDKIVPSQAGKATHKLLVYKLELSESGSDLRNIPMDEFGWAKDAAGKMVLKNVLSNLFQKRRTKRSMLFTWSHGAGFGINVGEWNQDNFSNRIDKEHTPEDGIIELKSNFDYLTRIDIEQINAGHLLPIIKTVEMADDELLIVKKEDPYNCTKAEILWMSDLANILEAALEGQQIDFLVMMNCNMQLFENGFMLRDRVKYLIGPESKMWVYGYDYKKLLATISAEPAISNLELCHRIISDYVQMHEALQHFNYLNFTTMFANSLETYHRISIFLETLTKDLLQRMAAVKHTIHELRANHFYSVSGRDDLFLLDITLWIKTIFQTPQLAPVQPVFYPQLIKDLESVAIAKHIGAEYLKSDEAGPKIYGHTGSSLFFPHTNNPSILSPYTWCAYFSRERSSRFQEATLWEEFVYALFSE